MSSASSSEGTIRSTTAGPTGPPPSCVPKSPWTAFVEPDRELDRQGLVETESLALRVDEHLPLLEREVVALADPDLGGVAGQGGRDRVGDDGDSEEHRYQGDDGGDEAHQAEAAGDLGLPRRRPIGRCGCLPRRSRHRRIAGRR